MPQCVNSNAMAHIESLTIPKSDQESKHKIILPPPTNIHFEQFYNYNGNKTLMIVTKTDAVSILSMFALTTCVICL